MPSFTHVLYLNRCYVVSQTIIRVLHLLARCFGLTPFVITESYRVRDLSQAAAACWLAGYSLIGTCCIFTFWHKRESNTTCSPTSSRHPLIIIKSRVIKISNGADHVTAFWLMPCFLSFIYWPRFLSFCARRHNQCQQNKHAPLAGKCIFKINAFYLAACFWFPSHALISCICLIASVYWLFPPSSFTVR